MAIEQIGTGGIAVTGEHIQLFRILSMEGRLKIEIAGMRFGMPTAPAVRELLGSTTKNKVKLLEELKAFRLKHFPLSNKGGN